MSLGGMPCERRHDAGNFDCRVLAERSGPKGEGSGLEGLLMPGGHSVPASGDSALGAFLLRALRG